MFFPACLISNAALLDQKETHKGQAWRGLSKTLGCRSVAGLVDKDVHPSAASLLSGVCSGFWAAYPGPGIYTQTHPTCLLYALAYREE